MLAKRDIVVVSSQVVLGLGLFLVYVGYMQGFMECKYKVDEIKSSLSPDELENMKQSFNGSAVVVVVVWLSSLPDDWSRHITLCGTYMSFAAGFLVLIAYGGKQRWKWVGVVLGLLTAVFCGNYTHSQGPFLNKHRSPQQSDFDDAFRVYLIMMSISVVVTIVSVSLLTDLPGKPIWADRVWKPAFGLGYLLASTSVIFGAIKRISSFDLSLPPIMLTLGFILALMVAIYLFYFQILSLLNPSSEPKKEDEEDEEVGEVLIERVQGVASVEYAQ